MSREITSPCPNCGKEIKSAGHIMAQCLAFHRLSNKVVPDRDSLTNKLMGGNRTRDLPTLTSESQKRPSFNTMLVNLRRVPMGQFMRDAAKEMSQLPFVITKDGKPFAIVGPFKGSEGDV